MPTTSLSPRASALVEEHLPLVRHVLSATTAHYPRHTDREELAQAATLGLVEAAVRFDPDRGIPFERWAARRVRGAIVDALRALDFAPRALRPVAREVDRACAALEGELGRTPTSDELAARAGLTRQELDRVQDRVRQSLVLSLDAPYGEQEGSSVTLGAALVDDVQPSPVEVLERREALSYLRDAVAVLPERVREVVVGYFLDGETSAQLAARLGVTESRVSQLRTQGLKLMRHGITAQYALEPTLEQEPGREAVHRAAYAEALARQGSFTSRLAPVPSPRRALPTPAAADAPLTVDVTGAVPAPRVPGDVRTPSDPVCVVAPDDARRGVLVA